MVRHLRSLMGATLFTGCETGHTGPRPLPAFAVAALALAAGCVSPPGDDATLELAIAPYEVPSGSEMLRCQEMALPSDTDVDVDRITWAFSKGNHHVHVYVSADGATAAPGGPGGPTGAQASYDCFQAIDFDKWHLLAATQDQGTEWSLPRGVAIHVSARQSILVQTHYLNTSSPAGQSSTATGTVTLGLKAPGSVTKRAAAIFAQNRDIHIPPHASGHVEGECSLPGASKLLALMGHFHVHGTKVKAWVRPLGKPPVTVYESEEQAHPLWASLDDVHLGPEDRLGWSCDYDNNGNDPLEYGPLEATQEHCNLFAFYTLDQGEAPFVPCVIDTKDQD